jgi:hypothetical protein
MNPRALRRLVGDTFWLGDTFKASRTAKKKGLKPFEIHFVPDVISIVAPIMVNEGGKILKPVVRQKLVQEIGNPRNLVAGAKSKSTGSLQNSIRVSNPFIQDNGTRFFANVYFDGYDEKRNIRQGEKAAYFHYGTGKSGIRVRTADNGKRVSTGSTTKTNFARKAERASQASVEAAMRAVLDKVLMELDE